MPRNDHLWTTTHEKQYIDGIGTWTDKQPSKYRTGFLLRQYVWYCCRVREKWGDINKEEVILYAQDRLNKMYE